MSYSRSVCVSHKNELCSYIPTHIQPMFINSLKYIFKEPNIQNTLTRLSRLIQPPSEGDIISAFPQMKT